MAESGRENREPTLAELGLDDDFNGGPIKPLQKRCFTCGKQVAYGLSECDECAEILRTSSTITTPVSRAAVREVEESWMYRKVKRYIYLTATTIVVVFGGAFMIGLANRGSRDESVTSSKSDARIESQFSAWDGSHKNLVAHIKESMNDPKSFEHIKSKYWTREDHLIVVTEFRGKNAYGGVVKDYVKAKVDMQGNILEILSP